jgi:hypothetical protein
MTQDIIEIAEACGFTRTHTGEVQLWLCNKNDLERLSKLVAAKEREACALESENCGAIHVAKRIRERGEA